MEEAAKQNLKSDKPSKIVESDEDEDDFEEFKYMGGTAKGLKALMKLRESYEGSRIPTQSVPVEGQPSKEELYQMVADPKYKTDPAYRQKVERMFNTTFGQ